MFVFLRIIPPPPLLLLLLFIVPLDFLLIAFIGIVLFIAGIDIRCRWLRGLGKLLRVKIFIFIALVIIAVAVAVAAAATTAVVISSYNRCCSDKVFALVRQMAALSAPSTSSFCEIILTADPILLRLLHQALDIGERRW